MKDIYDSKKLTKELIKAGLPVESVTSTGDILFTRDLTKSERKSADAVTGAHDTAMTDDEIILDIIRTSGIRLTDLIYPLWLKVMHDDSTQADELKTKLDQLLSSIHT